MAKTKEEKPKMGRPPRGASPGGQLSVKITDDERAAWLAAAGDVSLSDWVRDTCNARARRAR